MQETLIAINNVSLLVECFAPGYIFLSIIKYITGMKTDQQLYEILLAVIGSFIIRSSLIFAHGFIFTSYEFSDGVSLFFLCLAACVAALAVSACYRSRWLSNAFSKVFVKTFHANIWEDMVDYKGGTTAKLRMKDGTMILGGILEVEEKGDDSWLALDSFSFPDGSTNESSKNYEENFGLESALMVRVSDIESVQFLYESKE